METDLDELGILEGTDKSSLCHDYLRQYERVFAGLRHEPLTLLEIGVAHGASLRMWSRYFDRATIVGIDIKEECLQYAGDRREVEIGSQADAEFLNDLGRRRRPEIIIDDGSHRADYVLFTFHNLFPYLRPGGIYIVEDIHFHAGPNAFIKRGLATTTPQELFLRIAEIVACPGTDDGEIRDLAAGVDSVEFFHGAVGIRKKSLPDRDFIGTRRAIVERVDRPEVWGAFGAFVLNRGGDLAEAEHCLRRSVELLPQAASFHCLSQILERRRDMKGALEAAEQALLADPGYVLFQRRVEELRATPSCHVS